MTSPPRRYTAEEIRDMARWYDGEAKPYPDGTCEGDTRDMLLQAAEDASRLEQIEQAFTKLIADCEAVVEATAGVFVMAHVHGMNYSGPMLDLKAAKAALSSQAVTPERQT